MSDDTPNTPPEVPPKSEGEQPQATRDETPADKPKPSDKDQAAKIAAAKAKDKGEPADQGPKEPWEDKPRPPAHEDGAQDPDARALAEAVAGSVLAADRFAGELTLTVARNKLIEACRFLKNQQQFAFLVDLTAVDWPERAEGRFDVVYWMHRFSDSKRLRLRTVVSEDQPVGSVTGVWKTANWMEREVFDMFGIYFDGHPNLERILTWEGFNGHPLRKDFPVVGIDTGAAIYPDVYPPGGGPVTAAGTEEGGDQ